VPQHVFILGGTGQIGRAVGRNFLATGWSVTLACRGSRNPPLDLIEAGAKTGSFHRDGTAPLSAALADGADVIVDTIANDQQHGRELISVQIRLRAAVRPFEISYR